MVMLKRFLLNPLTYLLVAVYLVSAQVLTVHTSIAFGERVVGLLVFSVLATLMLVVTLKVPANEIQITSPRRESLLLFGYFVLWLSFNLALWQNFFVSKLWLSNGISFWFLLVVVPFVFLTTRGARLSDFGMTRQHLSGNIRATLLASILVGVLLLLITPSGRLLLNGKFSISALAMGFGVSLAYTILAAGFHEEFFFRDLLQTRFSEALKSPVSGFVLATLAFAIYHLPFKLYSAPAQGQFVFALTLCFTDSIFGGLVCGELWQRTRNLIAPVMVHALIDAISVTPQIISRFGFS